MCGGGADSRAGMLASGSACVPAPRTLRIESAIGCASAHHPDDGDDFAATAACLVQNFVRIAI